MKLLANENFPITSVKVLSNAGYDILSVGLDYSGISDKEVIDFANEDSRTIITFDRDYGELIFKKGLKPSGGVIYLRWESFTPERPGEYLLELLKSSELEFAKMLTVIAENKIRQRKY